MSYLSQLGLLSLGSQLKAFSDQLYAMADEVYRRHGIALQGRWFPVLRLLHDKGPMTVGEIAEAVGQTHSAISQLATRLVRDGWVTTSSDAADRRTRRLALTEKSTIALQAAKPLWRAIGEVLEERARAAGLDPARTIAGLAQVVEGDLADRITERARQYTGGRVRIVTFRPELREAFYRINHGWLSRYFELEEADVRVLRDPQGAILDGGGQVFFAELDGVPVGTCAIMQTAPGEFELTKMGVDPSAQGLGLGRLLGQAAIEEFRRIGGRVLFLESNSRLGPALRLYESLGFEHQPAVKTDSHYRRADVYMIWKPQDGAQAR